MIETRPSAQPRGKLCPASLQKPELPRATDSDDARLGSATHEVLGRYVLTGLVLQVEEAATRWRVDAEELSSLVRAGSRLWGQMAPYFPRPRVEQTFRYEADGVALEGAADVASSRAQEVSILDWKSGFSVYEDHREQLLSYAWIAGGHDRIVRRAYVATAYIRAGEVEGEWLDREQLDDWWRALVKRVQDPPSWRGGRHCEYCGRGILCQARLQYLRRIHGALRDFCASPPAAPLGPELAEILEMAGTFQKVADEARAIAEGILAEQPNQVLSLGAGRELALVRQQRQTVAFSGGAEYLVRHRYLTPDEVARAASLSKGKLEKLIAAKAPAGHKGAAVAEALAGLDRVGAINTTYSETVKVRQSLPVLENPT